MSDPVAEGRRLWTPQQKLLLRLIIFPVIIVAVWWVQFPGSDQPTGPARPDFREASDSEWALPIDQLGKGQLAKQLVYQTQQVRYEPGYAGAQIDNVAAQGDLVWFHHPQFGESVAYVPAAGEHPQMMAAALLDGITRRGNVVLYDLHGDAELVARMPTLAMTDLPAGWTVLTRPMRNESPTP